MQTRFGATVYVYECPAGHMEYWEEEPVGRYIEGNVSIEGKSGSMMADGILVTRILFKRGEGYSQG